MYCKHCNQNLPEDQYYFDKTHNRHKKICKNCTSVRRAIKRDKYNRRRRQYYAENKDKLAADARKYYNDNKPYRDKRLKQFSDYYFSSKQGKCFSSVQGQQDQILPTESFDPSEYSNLLGQPTKSR